MLKYTTKDDGTRFGSVREMRNALMDELAQGHDVIPCCPCDNFDFKKGCQGHRVEVPPDGTDHTETAET